MSLFTQLQSAASSAQATLAELGGTVRGETNATINSVALVVVTDSSRRGEELLIGGRLATLSMIASATRDQAAFDSVTPAEGMAFVHDGMTYKILSIEKDAIHWRFVLGQASQ